MSTTTLIMTLMLINDTFTHRVTNSLMPYVLFNLLGSVAVNGPGIAVYIKVICSQSISQSKIANMDTIIKHITSTRDRYIYLMKMDRYMADVNWTYVREMTTIIQPYDTNDIEVSNKNKLTTSTKCPFCSKIISLTLSNKKMMDLKRETKKQIWNYMKTIVVRQHEIGMVSRESLQMILKKFDHLLNDDNFETVDIAKLKDFFAKNKYLDFIQRIYNKFFSFQRANVLMPRKRYRRICYKIIMNKMFTILIYTINVAALKESIDEMIMVMNRVIDSSDTREYYLRKFVQDRDDLGQLMMKIQISYPWIPVTIKTKQMITSCRFVMTEGLLNLKASGFVDDIEYSQLMQSIKSKETLIKSVKRVKLPLAKIIFLSVPWMRMDDANTAEYLFIRSSVRVFESGYEFCKVGDYLDGILILLTGVLNIIYEPTEEILKKNKEYGYIPVVECLRSTILEDSSNFHILPGNTIGEINLLTGRPYDCRIVAVSNVKAYFINIKYIMEAIKQNSNLAYGLESSMWKHAVMRIAEKLLKNTPVYEFNTLREIQTKLERSIMPDFNAYEHFLVTDIIEDVILIDGIIIDSYSRTSYCAPYYIPRSVVKINLPKNEHSKQVAKLLIIPIPDVDYLTMINAEPRVVELVPSGDSRCTYGPKVKKKRKKKGKKGKKELLQSYSSVVSKSIGSIASFHHSSHSLSIGSSKDKSIT
ncbi:PREDICTED: uncharacterized protein LOC108558365 [Nicrophorus vespilloides]|uniref:Uncharacterized protein LOC108558365 n=1 Tax=Nicrophorus vespilloides TaxID=110193 RepID=A0ABM1M849_NICVS|nr:PREDICTED: uncharacterized protein LOC108558365 [Nicrophorus vespilloides]